MQRNLFLSGELASMFGEVFKVNVSSFADAIKCVDVNRKGFKQYLRNAAEAGTGFSVRVGDKELTEDDLTEPMEGDFYIDPIPQGSKSGTGKILAALALLALLVINPGYAMYGYQSVAGAQATFMGGASLTAKGMFVASLATNLALSGIQQLMAPDPATDKDQPDSYLFNGAQQNILEGDPIPLLYGELRVPGTPVSFEIVNRDFPRNNVTVDSQGNLILVGV